MKPSPDPTRPAPGGFTALRNAAVRYYWWLMIPLLAVVFWPTTIYPLPWLEIKTQIRMCTPFAAALIVITHFYMREKKDMAKWKQFLLGLLAVWVFVLLYLGVLGESLMK